MSLVQTLIAQCQVPIHDCLNHSRWWKTAQSPIDLASRLYTISFVSPSLRARAHTGTELLSSAKDVQAMADARHENENLREQVKLLKQSMSALFENQRKAQEEVEYLRKVQSKGMRARD